MRPSFIRWVAAVGVREKTAAERHRPNTLTYRQWGEFGNPLHTKHSEHFVNTPPSIGLVFAEGRHTRTDLRFAEKLGDDRKPTTLLLHEVPRSSLPTDVLRALRDSGAVDENFPLSNSQFNPLSCNMWVRPNNPLASHEPTHLPTPSSFSYHDLPYIPFHPDPNRIRLPSTRLSTHLPKLFTPSRS